MKSIGVHTKNILKKMCNSISKAAIKGILTKRLRGAPPICRIQTISWQKLQHGVRHVWGWFRMIFYHFGCLQCSNTMKYRSESALGLRNHPQTPWLVRRDVTISHPKSLVTVDGVPGNLEIPSCLQKMVLLHAFWRAFFPRRGWKS